MTSLIIRLLEIIIEQRQKIEEYKGIEQEIERLKNEEDALINFTGMLNTQTMDVGQMEMKLKKLNLELDEKNKKLIHELGMAKRVQLQILPSSKYYPKRVELDMGSSYSPMEDVGGDIYDIIKIEENLYGFFIADVSGHGVPAALITTIAKVSFNANAKLNEPDRVCKKVNSDIYKLIGDLGYYLTAYYCTLNLITGELLYTNAGHLPALLYRAKTNTFEELTTKGIVIGILKTDLIEYSMGKIILEDNDKIILYTDGVVEARDPSGNLYGNDRLNKFLIKNSDLSSDELAKKLNDEINKFRGNNSPQDDIAILCFEFHKNNYRQEDNQNNIEFQY